MKSQFHKLISIKNDIVSKTEVFMLLINFAVLLPVLNAQSFKKGSLVVGVSEGSTMSHYRTTDVISNQVISDGYIKGDRDPLQIEYGISSKWGIALSLGTDIFKVNPQQYYRFGSNSQTVKSQTNELIVEGNYHFYVTNKWDIVAFGGLGTYNVKLSSENNEFPSYSYEKGRIIRTGIKARYYFSKRWAILGMLSFFSASAQSSNKSSSDAITPDNILTQICGRTLEFGISYRILR